MGYFFGQKVQKVQNCTLVHNLLCALFDQKVLWSGLCLVNLGTFDQKAMVKFWEYQNSIYEVVGFENFSKILKNFQNLGGEFLTKKCFAAQIRGESACRIYTQIRHDSQVGRNCVQRMR